MSVLVEFEEITSRRFLLDLIDRHGHVVITQNGEVIFGGPPATRELLQPRLWRTPPPKPSTPHTPPQTTPPP